MEDGSKGPGSAEALEQELIEKMNDPEYREAAELMTEILNPQIAEFANKYLGLEAKLMLDTQHLLKPFRDMRLVDDGVFRAVCRMFLFRYIEEGSERKSDSKTTKTGS